MSVLSYWGGWFPPGGPLSYWGGWFPEDIDLGALPTGVAALVLDEQVTVVYGWRTGLFKSYSGLERRASHLDDPSQRYEGSTILDDTQTRSKRAALARYAALGRPFSIGLPYEALTLRGAAVGAVVPVYTTSLSDWAVVGGRVIVRHKTHGSFEGVIASVAADSITLTASPGLPGSRGAVIMPTIAAYLDPQQTFGRYPTRAERWQIKARAAIAGFASAAQTATLPLEAPQTNGGALEGLTLYARSPGADGNDIIVTQSHDALTSGGELVEDADAKTLTIKYLGDTTTVDEYIALINSGSSLVYVTGTYTGTDVLASGDDEFAATNLSGGLDVTPAEVGKGATVQEFAGRPVWDRGIEVEGVVSDSIQSMAEVQDLGGLPFAAGSAAVPDWGRALLYSALIGAEWQWIKRFLDTVRGRWRTFWLASWRPDLVPVSVGAGTLTITDDGDFSAWWPAQQQYVQTREVDGTLIYARISAAADNGDGTLTLSLVDEDDDPVTLGSTPDMVSWLDRVRFESDEIAIKFAGIRWTLSETVRVVQQPSESAAADTLDRDEASVEESQPREGIEWILPVQTICDATGTRDIVIDGRTFHATPAGREEIQIAVLGDDSAHVVHIPLTHPVAVRYLQGGLPPKNIAANVWRHQVASDEGETVWRGVVTSVAIEGHVMKVQLASHIGIAVRKRIPTVTAGRGCSHIFMEPNTCRVDRAPLTASGTTSVAGFNGRDVTVAVSLPINNVFQFGEIIHSASGERMTIQQQLGSVITMQAPIYGMAIGDTVIIYPGCDHTITTCDVTYSNRDNFGGFPQLPEKNPVKAARLGLGVVVQE